MGDGTPKRSWWRKKRWIAASGVPAFLIAYPASLGVVAYGVGRGIVSENTRSSSRKPFTCLWPPPCTRRTEYRS